MTNVSGPRVRLPSDEVGMRGGNEGRRLRGDWEPNSGCTPSSSVRRGRPQVVLGSGRGDGRMGPELPTPCPMHNSHRMHSVVLRPRRLTVRCTARGAIGSETLGRVPAATSRTRPGPGRVRPRGNGGLRVA